MANNVVRKRLENLMVEDARILFRNFAGEERQFNPAGERNFTLVIDNDIAPAMLNDGWNIKYLKPREEGDDPQAILRVKVSYKRKPPTIVLISSKSNGEKVRQTLPEDLIDMLDYIDIAKVDLIVNPSWYDFNGRQGYSAYLKSIYVTMLQDDLEKKYSDIPEASPSEVQNELEQGFDPFGEPLLDLGEVEEQRAIGR
ncbi:hypothetical protein SEA_GIANTSBANE_64 [Arthrobacter phage Giantsbane]|nr:hypothetical protein SEA_GIANTSBANE_64 [Arthrobacter phage Giantsbane]